ncbi:MAG: uridine [Desulfobulbaceae bacterium]|nr:MAG: uridine [Desulfobulbaceae bacterium]
MNDSSHDSMVMCPVRTRKEKMIPELGFLFVNPVEAGGALSRIISEGGSKRFLFNSKLCVNKAETLFVAGPAIGAPMAVLSMEKLIVLGAKRIVLVGWCGALLETLKVGDIILPGQALCGEGTSHYYSENQAPQPSANVLSGLRAVLSQSELPWQEGRVWSTDAPYRESRSLLSSLQMKHNIAAIDMEYSALCTVAQFRHIEFAACMLVSDELWQNNWKPGFTTSLFRQRSQQLTGLLLAACGLGLYAPT